MRPRDRLGFGTTVAVERSPDASERKQRPVSLKANQTTSFFLVSGFGSGVYSAKLAKLLAGTRHRFSGLSHTRQCGDDVLRILVTGGPPVRGGGGMPQRIVTISRPPSVSWITGAG